VEIAVTGIVIVEVLGLVKLCTHTDTHTDTHIQRERERERERVSDRHSRSTRPC